VNIYSSGYFPVVAGQSHFYSGGISYVVLHSGLSDINLHNELYNNGSIIYPTPALEQTNGIALIAQDQPSLLGKTYLTSSSSVSASAENWQNMEEVDLRSYP
jgi:hypothetical protein